MGFLDSVKENSCFVCIQTGLSSVNSCFNCSLFEPRLPSMTSVAMKPRPARTEQTNVQIPQDMVECRVCRKLFQRKAYRKGKTECTTCHGRKYGPKRQTFSVPDDIQPGHLHCKRCNTVKPDGEFCLARKRTCKACIATRKTSSYNPNAIMVCKVSGWRVPARLWPREKCGKLAAVFMTLARARRWCAANGKALCGCGTLTQTDLAYEQIKYWLCVDCLAEIKRASDAKRRGIMADGDGSVTASVLKAIRLAKRCSYCLCSLAGKKVHADHVWPLASGGMHRAGNLTAACPTCNHSKGPLLPIEWARGLPVEIAVRVLTIADQAIGHWKPGRGIDGSETAQSDLAVGAHR
jgi:5-methylcytosine-specific restriction endonuclease McrA